MKMFKHTAFASMIAMGISGTAYADSDEEVVNCSGENRSYEEGMEAGKAEGIAECQKAGTTANCPHVDTHALFSLSEGTLQMPSVDVPDEKGITTYQVEMKLISSGAENEFTFSVSSATPIESEDTPPSSSDDLRFTDNGDGTVTDNHSGLIWLKQANCFEPLAWDEAKEEVSILADGQCGLADESKEGDWRLPSIKELQSLISYGYEEEPALSNAAGTGQWTEGDAFSGVHANYYWSTTTFVGYTNHAWYVSFGNGSVGRIGKASNVYVWPVRDVKSVTELSEPTETGTETSETGSNESGETGISETETGTPEETADTQTEPDEAEEARYTDNGDGTVTDNNTGLVWLKNANCFGLQNWETAMDSAAKLADGQCGLSDGSTAGQWRLPTKEELLEKVVESEGYFEMLKGAFSGVQANNYWSSTTFAGGASGAWNVNVNNGNVGANGKFNAYYVWPVRGGKSATTESAETPAEPTGSTETGESDDQEKAEEARYTDNGDGTVTDNNTGLVWLKNANCFDKQNWDDAMQNAKDLASNSDKCDLDDGSKAGDWRLPTKDEWKEVVGVEEDFEAAKNTDYFSVLQETFSGVQSNLYWSSSTYANSTGYAWGVYLDYGIVTSYDKASTGDVWPVRGGK